MFAPEGFTPFADFASDIYSHAAQFRLEYAYPLAREGDSAGRIDRFREAGYGESLFAAWLIDYCFTETPVPLYLASPKGDIVVASHLAFYSKHDLGFYEFDWPLEAHADELSRFVTPEHSIHLGFNDENYLFVDESFCIHVRDGLEERGFDVDPVVLASTRAMAFFDGWSICFKDSDNVKLRESIGEVYHWPVLTDPKRDSYAFPAQKRGRRSKQGQAKEIFDLLFPNGRGEATWKEVVLALKTEGVYCSTRTLQRALGLVT